jgi:hypothetical protein
VITYALRAMSEPMARATVTAVEADCRASPSVFDSALVVRTLTLPPRAWGSSRVVPETDAHGTSVRAEVNLNTLRCRPVWRGGFSAARIRSTVRHERGHLLVIELLWPEKALGDAGAVRGLERALSEQFGSTWTRTAPFTPAQRTMIERQVGTPHAAEDLFELVAYSWQGYQQGLRTPLVVAVAHHVAAYFDADAPGRADRQQRLVETYARHGILLQDGSRARPSAGPATVAQIDTAIARHRGAVSRPAGAAMSPTAVAPRVPAGGVALVSSTAGSPGATCRR